MAANSVTISLALQAHPLSFDLFGIVPTDESPNVAVPPTLDPAMWHDRLRVSLGRPLLIDRLRHCFASPRQVSVRLDVEPYRGSRAGRL